MEPKTCSIPSCGNKSLARGWCSRHWQRWKRHGNPIAGQKDRPDATPEDRFWASITRTDDCWKWTELLNDGGYGLIRVGRKNVRAHRFAWELLVGDIPKGMQIDHRCRNRECVNPKHLRLATNKQNAEHKEARSASGYRGVSFNRRRSKWVVQVMHDGRNHYGGYFEDVHEAAEHAKALRNELFTHNELDRKTA